MRIDVYFEVCAIDVDVLYRQVLRDDLLALMLVRSLYCASLQCAWCRRRRRQDDLKCGRLFVGELIMINADAQFHTVVGITPAGR